MLKLQNTTVVTVRSLPNGGKAVQGVHRNPSVAVRAGTKTPILGNALRLMTVAEVVKASGLSKNKAQAELRTHPLNWAVPFDGSQKAAA